jgi:hypothetical protein
VATMREGCVPIDIHGKWVCSDCLESRGKSRD